MIEIGNWIIGDLETFSFEGKNHKCRALIHIPCQRQIHWWDMIPAERMIFYCAECWAEAPDEVKKMAKMAMLMDKI